MQVRYLLKSKVSFKNLIMRIRPKIFGDQVIVLRAEANTGIVLDDNFKKSFSEDDVIYSVFDGYVEAMNYIIIKKEEFPKVEFTVLDSNSEVVYYHSGL